MVEDALRVLAGRVATTARESRTGLLGRLTAGLGQQHRRAFKASSSSSSACTWEKKHTLTLLQEYDPGGGAVATVNKRMQRYSCARKCASVCAKLD